MSATPRPEQRSRADQFWERVSPGSRLCFYTAVFLVFSPMMLLVVTPLTRLAPWPVLLFWLAASGTVAVGWAVAFTIDRRLLWLALPGQVGLASVMAFRRPAALVVGGLPDVAGIFVTLCIASGYVFFILFISGEGRRTLRDQAELDLARQIHVGLVPAVDRTTPTLELFGRSAASGEMGGDLLDVVDCDGTTHVFVGDVSGHGVRCGVVLGMLKSAIRTRLREPADLGRLLDDLDEILGQLVEPGMFATLAVLRLGRDQRVEYALAGHPPILHWRAASRDLIALANRHRPLGLLPAVGHTADVASCEGGDLFVLYTDGLTEAADAADDEFGQERLAALVGEQALRPLAEIHAVILGAVRAHGRQVDDQSLLLVRVR